MKKNIFFILAIIVGIGFSSCKKTLDSENVATGMVNYPNIVMAGDQFMTILVGETYTDKGAKAFSGTTEITNVMTTEGTVNTNTAGVYTIKYSVTNDEDRSLSINRYVGVVTPAAAVMDISGIYVRDFTDHDPNRKVSMVKKDYPGLYTIDNPGGLRTNVSTDAPFFVTVYLWQTDVGKIVVPVQNTGLGDLSCTNGTFSSTATDSTCVWRVINGAFGTGLRTFIKKYK